MRVSRAGLIAAVLVTALLVGSGAALGADPPESGAANAWPAPNGDLAGTRAAQGSAMSAGAVPRLRRIWRFVVPEQPTFSGVISATPLVLGGVVYVQTLHSNVYALDARTGRLEWSHRFDRLSEGPNGLAAGYGRLYGVAGTALFALDRRSGRLLWSRRIASFSAAVDIAPAVAHRLVFAGTVAQAPGEHGSLLALDVASGRIVWRRSTERGSWPRPGVASGGGVWWTPTIDGAGGLWAGTANLLPWGGTRAHPNGGAHTGSAPYTDSLLALGAADGRIRWSDQVTAHDVRDYDFALPPMLARAGGRELAIGSGKGGRVIAWDRRTHARVWTAVVGRHLHDTGPLPVKAVTVCPGLLGGVLTPMAIARGRVFVPIVNLCMRGSAVGYERLAGVDFAARGRGEVAALDASTGRAVWTRLLPSPVFGCATAAGDAVFTTTFGGRVYALAQSTGRTLWSVQEPAGSNACPAVAGNLLVVPAGAEPSTIATPTPVVDGYSTG